MSTFCECGEAFCALNKSAVYALHIWYSKFSCGCLQNKSSHNLWWISVRRSTSHVHTISFCLSGTTDLFSKVLSRLFRTESRHALCETGRQGILVLFSCREVSNFGFEPILPGSEHTQNNNNIPNNNNNKTQQQQQKQQTKQQQQQQRFVHMKVIIISVILPSPWEFHERILSCIHFSPPSSLYIYYNLKQVFETPREARQY